MSFWNRHFYGPVAAIRPYLFQKCFLLLVATDALVLMAERGCRYGVDGFNVAHFRWLDALQQQPPTATYYVCLLMCFSFLAYLLVLIGSHRPLLALLAVLYTYLWAMSRLDAYLHHYLVSLILSCLVFFPKTTARELYQSLLGTAVSPAKNVATETRQVRFLSQGWIYCGAVLILAVAYRYSLSRFVDLSVVQRWISMFVFAAVLAVWTAWWVRKTGAALLGPLTSAWAFRLLGTTVGVVYIFTSLAKADAEWCGGHTLRQIGATEYVLQPVAEMAGRVGVPGEWFWSILATLVIPLELTLAVSYLLAVSQDEPLRRRTRWWCSFAFLLAIGLHLNNEMMNLTIQWFGYYMLFLATFFLLPARVLWALGLVFILPAEWWQTRFASFLERLSVSGRTAVLAVSALATMSILVSVGYYIGLPGCIWAFPILASLLVVILVVGVVAGWEQKLVGLNLAAALVGLVMAGAVAQCSMRFDYYLLLGRTLQQLGQQRPAIVAFETAAGYRAPNPREASDLNNNLALAYRQLQDYPTALRHYQTALALQPSSFLAHYNLANMLRDLQRFEEAIRHYRFAVEIKPDFSDAHANLGTVLEHTGDIRAAISHYELALRIEPEAQDLQVLLQNARAAQRRSENSRQGR